MDEYGFSAAQRMGLRVFETSSRGSGRTMRMIERARDGDQIITHLSKEAKRLESLLRKAGKKKVRVYVCGPDCNPMEIGRANAGRTFFDHSWMLMHFEQALHNADRDLECLQREMSATWPEAPEIDNSGARMIDEARHW